MKTMKMPGFTAESSIYKTNWRYCMATAFDSQNAFANVQPAHTRDAGPRCAALWNLVDDARDRRDWLAMDFFLGAVRGAGCI